jgi:hypothetical protein
MRIIIFCNKNSGRHPGVESWSSSSLSDVGRMLNYQISDFTKEKHRHRNK